jgi:hypothetical protein
MKQVITPNPNIPCQPGWCLQYVRQAFGLPARYGTATEAWQKSPSQHRDRDFPAGVWHPVWFSLANEPAGHVALRSPSGTVYSTSDLGSVPHQHLDLSDLMNYYARYDMTLTYLGWTEDVAGYPVIADSGLSAQGSIKEGDFLDMANEDQLKRLLDAADRINGVVRDAPVLNVNDGAYMNNTRDAQFAAIMAALGKTLNKDDGGYIVKLVQAIKPGTTDVKAVADALAGIIPASIVKEVADELSNRLKG